MVTRRRSWLPPEAAAAIAGSVSLEQPICRYDRRYDRRCHAGATCPKGPLSGFSLSTGSGLVVPTSTGAQLAGLRRQHPAETGGMRVPAELADLVARQSGVATRKQLLD